MHKLSFTLKAAAMLLAGVGLVQCTSKNTPGADNGNGDVRTLTTTADRSVDLANGSISFSKPTDTAATITINPEVRFQEIDGFGAAITGSTCYNLMQMSEKERHDFLVHTFSPSEGYGFSYARISIGCSDFSMSEYSCCDKPGIENFALTAEETDYVIPILKEILAINPDLKIMGSPWTPPLWMKVNNPTEKKPHNKWTSGSLNPDLYAEYAEYFVRWIKAFNDNGINIYSVTPQNEPLNRGNSASCFMSWQEQCNFIKSALGPAIQKNAPQVRIYAFDHNYNYDDMDDQHGYPLNIYNDPEAAKYLAGAAYHNYGGRVEELDRVHNAAPQKELVFSETSIGTWNGGRDLSVRLTDDMEEVALGTVNRWCRGAIVWNLMLDSEGAPNRPGGCRTCFGAVDISKDDYSTITLNSHYYILAHMASVVKPGAIRIASEGVDTEGVTYAAFINPDGSHSFVICNDTDTNLPINVTDGSVNFTCEIPAHAVKSTIWTPAE